MNLLCKYYSNSARLVNSMQYMSTQPSFRFFCVSGMVIKNKRNFKILTDKVTLVVACVMPGTGKNSMMVLTTDTALKESDNTYLDMSTLEYDPIFYNLCLLLQEKHKASKNPVTVEFSGKQMVVVVSINGTTEGELQCCVHGPSGDLVIHGSQNVRDMLSQCSSISSFRYAIETPESHREIAVKRGRTELFKEIARYLNRTLVLVAFLPNGDMLEQYISSSSLLEIVVKGNGMRIYKRVTGDKLQAVDAFCVYQSTAEIEDIIKEQGEALSTTRRG